MRDGGIAGVHEPRDAPRSRRERAQHVHPSRLEVLDEKGDAGDVAAGPLERSDQPGFDRIVDAERDDRKLARCPASRMEDGAEYITRSFHNLVCITN